MKDYVLKFKNYKNSNCNTNNCKRKTANCNKKSKV